MFVAGQPRYSIFSFIFDSYHLGVSGNINRCKQILKTAMSNIEDSGSGDNTDNKSATTEPALMYEAPSTVSVIYNNFRRARSAENISGSVTSWSPESVFYWNYPSYYPIPLGDYYGNNVLGASYPCVPNHPPVPNLVPNPYYSNDYRRFSGRFVDNFQGNTFFNGIVPLPFPSSIPVPNTLLSSQSLDSMQRRYQVRRNNSTENLTKYAAVNPKVLKLLSKRYWEDVRKEEKSSKQGVEFTLMSYNVLAQGLITEHPYLYKNHKSSALQWENRWNNLLGEINKLKPDIMCLQEVQESHLPGFYNSLESMGYKGIYKKRTGIRCDGCAIYYKTNKFNLVEYETVEFYQPKVDILNRDNIAIIAKFSPSCSQKSEFIVATTHLLYNPKRQDVRLAQTQLLLTEVERLSHYKSGDGACYVPIILTGDFNSTPDSAVYELISKGILRYDHLAARRLDNSKSSPQGSTLVPRDLEITDKCQHARLVQQRNNIDGVSRNDEAALIKLHNSDKRIAKVSTECIQNPTLFCTGTLSHIFAFKSVYTHGDPENVEGTTFQNQWISVDYIFYSGEKRDEDIKDHKLILLSRYRLPLKSELGSVKIPNSAFGSDHLSLVAKFKLKI